MSRVPTVLVLIGLAGTLASSGATLAAPRTVGEHRHRLGPGYLVEEVGPNTPAARAGIRPGDRIIAIDGLAVNNSDDIDRGMARSGDAAVVTVERAGRSFGLRVAPRALTPAEAEVYAARSRRVLGVVGTELRLMLRPGSGANDVYSPPPIPPEPPPPAPIIVN